MCDYCNCHCNICTHRQYYQYEAANCHKKSRTLESDLSVHAGSPHWLVHHPTMEERQSRRTQRQTGQTVCLTLRWQLNWESWYYNMKSLHWKYQSNCLTCCWHRPTGYMVGRTSPETSNKLSDGRGKEIVWKTVDRKSPEKSNKLFDIALSCNIGRRNDLYIYIYISGNPLCAWGVTMPWFCCPTFKSPTSAHCLYQAPSLIRTAARSRIWSPHGPPLKILVFATTPY